MDLPGLRDRMKYERSNSPKLGIDRPRIHIKWMMQPILLVIIVLTLLLLSVFAKTGWGVVSDALQTRSTQRERSAVEHSSNLQLANTLRQTYTVLSLTKRQAKWRDVMVVKIVKESDDVRSYYLVGHDYEPLPAFLPGQHILVKCSSQETNTGISRCYSLSDDCSTGHWRISVKKTSNHPQSVSCWLHEDISVGDVLQVRGPSGAFFLQTAADRKVVLVCAGIGVTPMLPMLMEAIRRHYCSVLCFSQFRDVAHMPFADLLLNLAQRNPQVALSLWVSRFPKGVRRPWQGPIFEGKFQAKDLTQHSDAIELSDYYLCGPEEWQEKIRRDLLRLGVPSDSIRYELFQPTEKSSRANGTPDSVQHCIHFKQSRANAKFQTNQASLLACAGQNNVVLESGCGMGACGTCAVRLVSGKVRYTREPQHQIQISEILPCVCVPESDLEIDA